MVRTGIVAGSKRLPIRPAPHTDEMLIGYLGRVMLQNGESLPLKWARWFQPKGDLLSTVASLGLDVGVVSQLVGPPPARQRLALPSGLVAADFHQLHLRWCPHCLSDNNIYLGSWALKLMTVCVHHRVRLVECCPDCQQTVRLTWAGTGFCPCGGRLSESQTKSILPNAHWLCACLTQALAGHSSLNPQPFSKMGIGHWLRLIRYLGPFGLDLRSRRPGQLAHAHLLSTSVPLTDACSALLVDWPTHFEHLLYRLMHRGPPDASLQRTFARLYRVLYRDLAGEPFRFLREAFEAFLAENWWGVLGKRNRRLSPELRKDTPGKTRQALCAETGVSPKQLDWLIEQGQLTVQQFAYASGRQATVVRLNAESPSLLTASKCINLQTAARKLGLAKHRVRALLDAGLLRSYRPNPRSAWLIDTSSIDALLADCLGQAKQDTGKTTSLGIVLKHWRRDETSFIPLIHALLSGELHVPTQEHPERLSEVRLDVTSTRLWLADFARLASV